MCVCVCIHKKTDMKEKKERATEDKNLLNTLKNISVLGYVYMVYIYVYGSIYTLSIYVYAYTHSKSIYTDN